MGKRVSLSLRFNQFNLMGAGDECTCEHKGTNVNRDGGMHAITGRTTGKAEINDRQWWMKKY